MRSLLEGMEIIYKVKKNDENKNVVIAYFKQDKHLNTIYEEHSTTDRTDLFRFLPSTSVGTRLLFGVAVCSTEDTFNFEYGKKLARKRLLRKFYRNLKRDALKDFKNYTGLVRTAWCVYEEAAKKEDYYNKQAEYIAEQGGKK